MNRQSVILGLLAAATLVGAPMAQAEGFKAGRRCSGSSLTTCASAEASELARYLHAARLGDGRDGPRSPTVTGEDGPLPTPCPTGGDGPRNEDLCGIATTVTPEPVSMALMATGLVGIMGASRRKKWNRALKVNQD
jgi:hypothetical protein